MKGGQNKNLKFGWESLRCNKHLAEWDWLRGVSLERNTPLNTSYSYFIDSEIFTQSHLKKKKKSTENVLTLFRLVLFCLCNVF